MTANVELECCAPNTKASDKVVAPETPSVPAIAVLPVADATVNLLVLMSKSPSMPVAPVTANVEPNVVAPDTLKASDKVVAPATASVLLAVTAPVRVEAPDTLKASDKVVAPETVKASDKVVAPDTLKYR